MFNVTYDYYINTFLGESVDETDFPKYLKKSEEIVFLLTYSSLTESVLANMNEYDLLSLKKAVCAQIEYFVYYGLDISISGLSGTSYSVGKVHVLNDKSSGTKSIIAPMTKSYLEQTNLMNPGRRIC